MISSIISRLVILVFGTLYPAYASYKAVRTKNLKEYVKWMMYWIVFALFTCTETFTDVFLSWFPFYYEVKIVLVLWLLSPATKGSSILYRKFVHPALCRREQEIDEYIAKAKDQGYHTVLNLGTKGVNYATTVIMQTAIKGGGGLVQQLRKSYSLSDLSECEPREERVADESDDVMTEPRLIRRVVKTGYRRSASESNSRSPMYFPEVDVDVRSTRSRTDEPDFSHIKSTEDISSGYSSADNSASLTRTASTGARTRGRLSKTTVTPIKRPQAAEENQLIIEELHDDDSFQYSHMPPLVNIPSPIFLSHTNPPFIYQYIGNEVKIIQVLGDYPLNTNFSNQSSNSKQGDQKEINETQVKKVVIDTVKEGSDFTFVETEINKQKPLVVAISESDTNPKDDKIKEPVTENEAPSNSNSNNIKVPDVEANEEQATMKDSEITNIVKDFKFHTSPSDKSINSDDSAESDDEASFGTPDDSPKSKQRALKGKYGKGKAPPPPKIDNHSESFTQATLNDFVNILPHTAFKPNIDFKVNAINSIAEKKIRHKSKALGKFPMTNSSGIVKLLQLPGKLAFWHKDDKYKNDTISTSSGDGSSRSSTIENAVDEFQSCTDLYTLLLDPTNEFESSEMADNTISYNEVTVAKDNFMSQDIMSKSDALQKIIEAKLVNHPEYKLVSLHEETLITSKSTDV